MINALGLLEVYGLVAGIEAADAMLKSANVRLLNYSITNPGLVTLVVEGDLAACRASLDAGSAAASKLGKVICRKEIGRPDKGTEWLVQSFVNEDKEEPNAAQKEVETESSKIVETIPADREEKTAQKKESIELPQVETPKVAIEKKVAPIKEKTVQQDDVLLAFLQTKVSKGANLTDMAKHLSTTTDDIKHRIHQYVTQKIVRKKNNRYYIIEEK